MGGRTSRRTRATSYLEGSRRVLRKCGLFLFHEFEVDSEIRRIDAGAVFPETMEVFACNQRTGLE